MSRRTRPSHGGIHTPVEACYHACTDFYGGIKGVSEQMCIRADLLQKKLDDDKYPTNVLTLSEAMHILVITGDARILDAINAVGGAVWFYPQQVPQFPADMDVLKTGTHLVDSAVKIITELQAALEDSHIDEDERARLDKCFMNMHQALNQTDQTARAFEV